MRDPTRLAFRDSVERDLARLADGTLDPSRRERTERLVADSPELQTRLREQRRAVAAARSVAQRERAPLAVRLRRRSLLGHERRRRGRAIGLGLVGAVGALAWTVTALGAGGAGLTVAQAAALAFRPATIAVGEPRGEGVTLPGLRAAGLPFPYWEDRFAWHATGARTDRLGGRLETTVFYRRGRGRIAYTIVAGARLPAAAPGGRTVLTAGIPLTVYPAPGGQLVVTWLRRGHTCVLSAHDVALGALSALAVWRGQGRLPY